MFRTRIAVALAGAMLVAAPAAAQDSPVVGAWKTTAETEMGKFEATMTVSQTADGYMIAIEDAPIPPPPGGGGPEAAMPPMESTISDVKVDGSSFSFKRSLTTPQGPMDLNYSGTVSGDALTAEVGSSFGAIPVTGTRL
jgi:hypothetical protein